MEWERFISAYREEIIRSTQEIIRIPSVEGPSLPGKPFGEGVDRALHYGLALALQMGFQVENVDGYAGYAEFGQGDETMGILVHLDVVPEGSDWTYPPYGGDIVDGRIYGRGAMDDKGPAIGALYAMKAVMDSGLKMNKKVRMIFGTDEESGWEDLKYYFQRQPMPDFGVTPDGDYPVINVEKGILTLSLEKEFSTEDTPSLKIREIKGGQRPNMVPDACVCSFTSTGDGDKVLTHLHSFQQFTNFHMKADFQEKDGMTITAVGKSAHASTPEKGSNAIGQMLAFLGTLGLGNSEMEKFILFLNDTMGTDYSGTGLNIALEDDVSGKLTLNLGMLELDDRSGKAVINIRYPVSYTQQQVVHRIEDTLKAAGIKLTILDNQESLHVPEEDTLVQTLKAVYTIQTGQPAKALAIGGGTYARAIKHAVAFGAQFPGSPEVIHQKDEYIEIEHLLLHTRIYAAAIAALCCDPTE